MSTQKIEEAIRQLYREGDRPLRDAAMVQLATIRRVAKTWREDLDATPEAKRELHEVLSAIAEEAPAMEKREVVTWSEFVETCGDMSIGHISQQCRAPIGAIHDWMVRNEVPVRAVEDIKRHLSRTEEI